MEVLSAAWRSDLALVGLAGGCVEHRSSLAIARPGPTSSPVLDGGFVLLRRIPLARDVVMFADLAATLLGDGVVTIGFDDPAATVDELSPFTRHGFELLSNRVLTCNRMPVPRGEDATVAVRPIEGADWDDLTRLRKTTGDPREPSLEQDWVAQGIARFLGAWTDGELVASVGVVRTEPHSARLTRVDVADHDEQRRLTRRLVSTAARLALHDLGARELLVVSSPDRRGSRMLEDLGFVPTETQWTVRREPVR